MLVYFWHRSSPLCSSLDAGGESLHWPGSCRGPTMTGHKWWRLLLAIALEYTDLEYTQSWPQSLLPSHCWTPTAPWPVSLYRQPSDLWRIMDISPGQDVSMEKKQRLINRFLLWCSEITADLFSSSTDQLDLCVLIILIILKELWMF